MDRLSVSAENMKGMVVDYEGLDESDINSVRVESGSVEVVNHFTYLGSNISREGDLTVELDCRITKAARAVGSLRNPIFQDRHFSIVTKCHVSGSGNGSSTVRR